MSRRIWRVRLGHKAEGDFATIIAWTNEVFGPRQSKVYRTTLLAALDALGDGPDLIGAAAREDIGPGLCSLHIARNGRRGRHFIICRVVEPDLIDVVRILHDAMDLARHVPPTIPEADS